MYEHGRIMKVGDQIVSTYANSGLGMSYMAGDFYPSGRLTKADGFARYGTEGMFNAIMGKEIFLNMYACNNIYTLIGARPYQHEGMRLMTDLAQKGNMGATTVRDGVIPDSKKAPMKQVRVPYKELTFAFDTGLSFEYLEDKDDVTDIISYVQAMGITFEDGLDTDVLRPTKTAQPTYEGEETTLCGISRIVASATEVGQQYDGTEITASHVSPWGGVASDMYPERSSGRLNNLDAYVDNAEGVLSLDTMRELHMGCYPYWANSGAPDNKIFGLSNVANEKLGSLMDASNVWRESVFVAHDFNGVKTTPGREGGSILMNSYRNIPMFIDGNYNYDPITKRVGSGVGEIHCLDLDHIYVCITKLPEFRSNDNWILTRELRDKMGVHMMAETRCDKFMGQGKVVNKTVQ